jgi:hypothetical protein
MIGEHEDDRSVEDEFRKGEGEFVIIPMPRSCLTALIAARDAWRAAERAGGETPEVAERLHSATSEFVATGATAMLFDEIDLDAIREEGIALGIQKAIDRLQVIGCDNCVEHVKDFQRAKAMP